MSANLTGDALRELFDEISTIFSVRVQHAREEMARAYWESGQVLRQFSKEHDIEITQLVKRVAGGRVSERTLWHSIAIYDHFTDFESLYATEHGMNISVRKALEIIHPPKPKSECLHHRTCSYCLDCRTKLPEDGRRRGIIGSPSDANGNG